MRRHQSFGVILVGKSALIREGVSQILRAENFRILASVSQSDELTGAVRARQLLFIIIHISDDFDLTVEQIEGVREQHPSARIAVVADRYRPTELDLAFQAGTTGYFLSTMSPDAFVKSIELVMMGESVFPPTFLSSAFAAKSDDHHKAAPPIIDERVIRVAPRDLIAPQLSPRETAILRCLIEGYSNKCIARKIDIAEATVKVHVKAILRKVRVQNRTQAAIWGMNNGAFAQPANSNSVIAPIDVNKPLLAPSG